jgi:hypothetical protein
MTILNYFYECRECVNVHAFCNYQSRPYISFVLKFALLSFV